MKAVLVIDMPSRCFNCPLHQVIDGDEDEFFVVCDAENWGKSTTHMPLESLDERPSWCPLKPMPSVRNDDTDEQGYYIGMFNYGWNECLKEIEK